MRPTPAPLFNYRKRQRQAIVSDPQQHAVSATNSSLGSEPRTDISPSSRIEQPINSLNSNPNGRINISIQKPENKYSGVNSIREMTKPGQLTARGGFVRGWDKTNSSSKAELGSGTNFVSGPSNRGQVNFSGRNSSYHSTTGRGREDGGSGRGTCLAVNQINKTCAPSLGSHVAPSFPTEMNSGFQDGYSCKTSHNSNVKYNANKNNLRTSSANSTLQQRGGGLAVKGRCNVSYVRSGSMTSSGSSSVSSCQVQPSKGCGNTSISSSKIERMLDDGDDSWVDQIPDILGDSSALGPTRKSVTARANKTPATSCAPDKSIRVFTCPISVVRSWAASNPSAGIVMFEVYGVIDSATLRDKSGTGKEFVLRDDSSSINCIFYEIDRDLPRLIRGQVHRVIGLTNSKKDCLKVISVRLAVKEERNICQIASQLSQQEMEIMASSHHEP